MKFLSKIIEINQIRTSKPGLWWNPRSLGTSRTLPLAVHHHQLLITRRMNFSSPVGLRKQFSSLRSLHTLCKEKPPTPQPDWWMRVKSNLQELEEWSSSNRVLPRIAKWFAGSAILFPSMDVLYTYICNQKRERDLQTAFLAGSVPEINRENYIARPGIEEQIAKVLQPPKGYSRYRMISGFHGTGKTTLVRHVGHQVPGVIYVDVLPNQTSEDAFAESFAKAISWSPPRRSWTTTFLEKFDIRPNDVLGSCSFFDTILEEFARQAANYRNNNAGKSPVLVLDNINRLAVRNPRLLECLQDIAKDAADNRHFVTVFVTSEGQAPLQLLARSAKSRLGSTITVGDLNYDEVHALLCEKRSKSLAEANAIYDVVGGRIELLQSILNDLDDGLLWPDICSAILQAATDDFSKVKRREGPVFESVWLKIAQTILDEGHIHVNKFSDIASSDDQYITLLSSNIFARAPRSTQILFGSKPVQLVAAELVAHAMQG